MLFDTRQQESYLSRIMLGVAVWWCGFGQWDMPRTRKTHWFFIDEARKRQECGPTKTSTKKNGT